MGMNLRKWKSLFYILTAWIALKLIAFIFGFTPWPDIAQLALMGGTYPIIVAASVRVVDWRVSDDNFTLSQTVRNAVIAAVVIGCVELMLTVILINNSQSFVIYVTGIYPLETNMDIPFLNLVISTWVGGILLSIPASASAYLLMEQEQEEVSANGYQSAISKGAAPGRMIWRRARSKGQRAQSAMEYLMTYGWSILIVAVVLGALFQLGVFSGSTTTGTACLSSPGDPVQESAAHY